MYIVIESYYRVEALIMTTRLDIKRNMKAQRRGSIIDDIPGIGEEKAGIIGTYVILVLLIGK